MTTTTATLTDFLLARIAEDEADAHRIGYDRRVAEMPGGTFTVDHPLKLLAECEAKRRIVELHSSTTLLAEKNTWAPGMCSGCNFDGYADWASRDDECPTLRALAAAYADHPDYREEWKP